MLGVVGDLIEDVVVWLSEPLRTATDTAATIHRRRGGSAANVAALAAPRYPTRFLGRIGADPVGDWLVDELSGHGVDVRVTRAGSTGTIVVLVDQSGERTMLPQRGAAVELDDAPAEWTTGLTHLHVPGYSLTVEPLASSTIEMIKQVHADGGSMSIDASSVSMLTSFGADRFRRLVTELAPSLLFANRDEADCLDLAEHPLPATTVLVKDGGRPTTVLAPDAAPRHVPVPPVAEIRDLTGAGDAFAAGFLTATLDGANHVAACVAGHALAATVLRSPGASPIDDLPN